MSSNTDYSIAEQTDKQVDLRFLIHYNLKKWHLFDSVI